MDNLKVILEGWKYRIFPSQAVKKMAHERAIICAGCDNLVNSKIKIKGREAEIIGKKCGKCTCPDLLAVVSSPSKECPEGHWGKENI